MALKSRMNRSERTQCFEYEDPYKIVLISRIGNGCKLSAETITNEDTEIRIKTVLSAISPPFYHVSISIYIYIYSECVHVLVANIKWSYIAPPYIIIYQVFNKNTNSTLNWNVCGARGKYWSERTCAPCTISSAIKNTNSMHALRMETSESCVSTVLCVHVML